MKISKAEMRILVKHFKALIERDVVGITATDAREIVHNFFMEVGQPEAGHDFSTAVHKYQRSPKMTKMIEEYDKNELGW